MSPRIGGADPLATLRSIPHRIPLARRGILTLSLSLIALYLLAQTAFPGFHPLGRSSQSPGFHDFDEAQYSMPLLHEHEEDWDLTAQVDSPTAGKGSGWFGVGSSGSEELGKPLVLVTGGAGQLGQSLLPRLAESYTVHVLDISTRPDSISNDIVYHRGSILPPSQALPSLLSVYSFTGVIHLAGVTLDEWCAPREPECLIMHEGGTKALLTQLKAHSRKGRRSRFDPRAKSTLPWVIHASSMDVFDRAGKNEKSPKYPLSALGRTKKASEDVVEDAVQGTSGSRALYATILRFGDVYGYPAESSIPQSFVSQVFAHAFTNKVVQYDSGADSMDLVHVDDAVNGILLAVENVAHRSRSRASPQLESINLVSGHAWSQTELVERIVEQSGSLSPLRNIGSATSNSRSDYANAHAASVLDWHPKVTLADGVRKTLAQLSTSMQQYIQRFHATTCPPSAAIPVLQAYKNYPIIANERNKPLHRLDGCMVQLGFDNDGFVSHMKCEDGQTCEANQVMLPSYNWNATFWHVHARDEDELGLGPRKARVRFEQRTENSMTDGELLLAIPKDGQDQEFGEVKWALLRDGSKPAHNTFDIEVAPDSSAMRLSLPTTGKQIHAVPNPTDKSLSFSYNAPGRIGEKFDMRMTVVCCPTEEPWPLLLDDFWKSDARYGTTAQIAFNSSHRLHECQRAEQAYHYSSRQLEQLQERRSEATQSTRHQVRSRRIGSEVAKRTPAMTSDPTAWALAQLPTCWNDCDSPTICVQTGDCRCVQTECAPQRDSPLLAIKRMGPASTSKLGALASATGRHLALPERLKDMDWKDVLLPAARAYISANPEFPKVHVVSGYEGEEEVEKAECHKLGNQHCFSADHVLYEGMRKIGVAPEQADLVVMPAYQQCRDAGFLIHTIRAHAEKTIPGLAEGKIPQAVALTHDWGICVDFEWDIWGSRKRPLTPPDILRDVMAFSVMGDYDSTCYRPHQDIVIPARSCQSNNLKQSFPDVESIKTVTARTVLISWTGTYWGTGKIERLRLTCDRGGVDQQELIPGRGKQAHWWTWGDYMGELGNARFCPCPRGIAGWSPRVSDAIWAGCIPVITTDATHFPFADFLDWSKFSISILPTQMDGVEKILKAIPEEQILELQANLVLVRDAFIYASDDDLEEELGKRGPLWHALHAAGMRLKTRYPTGGHGK